MRDWLATLLQVSYSTKSCGDDLLECIKLWEPLLQAIRKKQGDISLSELLSGALVRSLQIMDSFELNNKELSELVLPSNNDEMGSSSIEKSLDDHALSHCLSFLDVKDTCVSIERTSHRFLQVSRSRKKPFVQECLEWKSEDEEDEWAFSDFERSFNDSICTPFERLIHSKPSIPSVISLRSLSRFKITSVKFDPELADENRLTHHSLDFAQVVRVIAKDVRSCEMTIAMQYGGCCYFPSGLSHVTDIEFNYPSPSQFDHFCDVFSNYKGELRLSIPDSHTVRDYDFWNRLHKVKKIVIPYMDPDSVAMCGMHLDWRLEFVDYF